MSAEGDDRPWKPSDPAEPSFVAVEANGQQPEGYSAKLNVPLQPSMRADQAAKEILRALFRTIRLKEDGTRQDLDPEFLHDLRVAVRRTRTCLTQVRGVFPRDVVKHFRREFRWLGSVTGPTRDLDVFRLDIGVYRSLLPEAVRGDLDPLVGHLERCQRAEHARLVEALDSDRYSDLREAWERFLERAEPDATAAPNAGRPISEVANERIARRWKAVMKLGKSIGDASPANSLHRMRIECKKLRYLLEFFRSIYSPAELGAVVRELKRLQDHLGTFHDLQVQQDSLRRLAGEMLEVGSAPAASLMVMGRLAEQMEARQAEERGRFHERFDRLADRATRAQFKRLLGRDRGGRADA